MYHVFYVAYYIQYLSLRRCNLAVHTNKKSSYGGSTLDCSLWRA